MKGGLKVSVDVMCVDNLVLLVSGSKRLKFTTVGYIPNKLEKEIASFFNKIIDVYKKRGFSIHTMHMDPKFNCLGKLILGVDLNTTSARDHVPEI